MKLEKFKEKDHKRLGIIVFTIVCILLVSGVILYRTFAIFEVNTNQNVINGHVQGMGDLEFAFYKDNTLVKEVPKKDEGYSLDTSSSYCVDLLNDKQVSTVNWDYENWEVRLKNVSTTKTKCYLYFKQIYQEEELNGAIPDLGNGRLVPVKILEEQPTGITIQNMNGSYGGKVVKADITDKWYSYKDKQWANAVILKDGKVDDYSPGQEILESDIESYFVWIPRYKYKLFADIKDEYNGDTNTFKNLKNDTSLDNSGAKSIEIIFETREAGITNNNTFGTFLTHPAFTSFDSNGFWVGKFETGTTLTNNYNVTNSCAVQIKPNTYSWRYINVSNAFYTSYDYLRELDSHMMKNMEWGAVAYLASSMYGLCDEYNCTDIRPNNNSNYITGYSSKNPFTCGYTNSNEDCNKYEDAKINTNGENTYNYFDTRSKFASTTQNYYGVYDMSGCAWEYVMGVIQYNEASSIPATGLDESNNSGFGGNNTNGSSISGAPWPSKKYYNLYDYSASNKDYLRGNLGDGTKEFGPFSSVSYDYGTNPSRIVSSYYADCAYFASSTGPWFVRGGAYYHGSLTGILAFNSNNGSTYSYIGFRVILTP